jgi:hypothetical protein
MEITATSAKIATVAKALFDIVELLLKMLDIVLKVWRMADILLHLRCN